MSSHNNTLSMELLDIDKFIKVNSLEEVSDPVFFNGPTPTERGLLSNEIFGITKSERSGIYAYIDLGGTFIHPIVYKVLCKLNNKIPDIVNGTDFFIIDDSGDLIKSDDGHTGIDWFRKNFSKIKFKKNESTSRNRYVDFIEYARDKMWITKYIVSPPYYRDVDTRQASIGVGEINKLYSSLIIATRSIKDTSSYGLTLEDVTKARVQNILVQIFDWYGNGTTIGGQETPKNLPGKYGLIKRGLLYKTVDYSTRLVLSAPDVEAENVDDIMVNMDYAGLPLASAICNFKPFIMFWLRRFFENRFAGRMEYPVHINDKDTVMVPLVDYQIAFSDVLLEEQIERFIHGYSNRFIPIEIPIDKVEYTKRMKEKHYTKKELLTPEKMYLFMGGYVLNNSSDYNETKNDYSSFKKIDRPLTWCDLFYRAACEVTSDKNILVTRFPIDSYLNQFPTKVRIKSTIKTQPMVVSDGFEDNTKFYNWYPVINKEDIGGNTSPLFSDTFSMCNGLIGAMGADYDGDTVIVKPIYTIEANNECRKVEDSKSQIIGMNGLTTRNVSKENIMALYSLTIHPDDTVKFVNPEF